MAVAFSEVTGEQVAYNPTGFDEYGKLGSPAAEFPTHFLARRSTELTHELNPSTRAFREWVAAHGDAFANL